MIKGNNALDILGIEFLPEQIEQYNPSDTVDFINEIKRVNKLPFSLVTVFYSDDYWNFEGYTKANIDKHSLHYDFTTCPQSFREDLKNYVLINIIENRCKIGVIRSRMHELCKFFDFITENNYFAVEDITPSVVIDWLETFPISAAATYIDAEAGVLRHFFSYYNANFDECFLKEHFDALNIADAGALKAARENAKTKNIPEDFYNNTISAAVKTMNNAEAPTFYRGMACMTIIESQTGLRTGELFALKAGCIKPITIFNGETAYYLEYSTWKREKGNGVITTAITYVNELTKKAYDVLMTLYETKRSELQLPYLFLDRKGYCTASSFPVTPATASRLFVEVFRYFNKYFPTILTAPSDNPALPTSKYYSDKHLKVPGRQQEYIIKPTIMQFRVHMCSELYAAGVPMEYVERFMSHLSAEMAYYYVRPKTSPQEDMELALKTLKSIVTGETKPIGPDNGLMDKIKEFVEENHYSVEKDIDTICAELAQKIPIRIKTGGVCIKSSKFRECSKDAMTNEFYCAYGVCPNIYSFYYMVDVSYRQAQELYESIQCNRSNGHLKQVQKETNMLHTIIVKRLEPELAELQKVIEREGVDTVLSKYPQVADIVAHLHDVIDEVAKWKLMK